MWFKNLQLYRLPKNWDLPLSQLEAQLARNTFQPCASQDMQSVGWTPPRDDGGLVHAVGGHWLIALRTEQKLLPAAIVRQFADERADEIEAQQGYRPGRKQMREIRDRVTEELLPRAFSRRRTGFAWIDPAGGWLVVDAPSATKAEAVVDLLHKSLDDLPLGLLETQRSPVSVMTEWLAADEAVPAGFTDDRDCELKSPLEEKATVRYVRHPLDGDEVRGHLAGGKLPTRLALTWSDRLSFVLTDKLEVKRLAFLDIVQETAEQQAETADEQFDVDFALMTGELSRFIPDLVDALGGEAEGE